MPYLRRLPLGSLAVAAVVFLAVSSVAKLVVFRAADESVGNPRKPGELTYDPPR